MISEIDTEGTFGNATYLISDDANGYTGTFQIYRGLGLNGEKFSKAGAKLIKVGDVVTIKGKVVNYKGNTPQYAQGSTIVKLNDEGRPADYQPALRTHQPAHRPSLSPALRDGNERCCEALRRRNLSSADVVQTEDTHDRQWISCFSTLCHFITKHRNSTLKMKIGNIQFGKHPVFLAPMEDV